MTLAAHLRYSRFGPGSEVDYDWRLEGHLPTAAADAAVRTHRCRAPSRQTRARVGIRWGIARGRSGTSRRRRRNSLPPGIAAASRGRRRAPSRHGANRLMTEACQSVGANQRRSPGRHDRGAFGPWAPAFNGAGARTTSGDLIGASDDTKECSLRLQTSRLL